MTKGRWARVLTVIIAIAVSAGVSVFLGFGTTIGALGVKQTARYESESDSWGLGPNLVPAIVVLQSWQRRKANATLP
jgi:hypothetical protein